MKLIILIILIFFATFVVANTTQERYFDKEINNLKRIKSYISNFAIRNGIEEMLRPYYAGSLIDYNLVKKYECHVILLRLGNVSNIINIEKALDLPRPLSKKFYSSGDAARALVDINNAIDAVMRISNLTIGQAKTVFNLDCGSSIGAGVGNNFEIRGETLRVLGDIEKGFYKSFYNMIIKNPQIKIIILGSGGGYVYDAINAGRLIRQRNLNTYLGNNCYSACTLMFMGGVERIIAGPYPSLGFHQAFSSMLSRSGAEVRIAATIPSQIYTDIGRYTIEMGVNPNFIYQKMFSAGPYDMHYVDSMKADHARELCESKYATWVKIWPCL